MLISIQIIRLLDQSVIYSEFKDYRFLALIYSAEGLFFILTIQTHHRSALFLVQKQQDAFCLIKMSDKVGLSCTCILSCTIAKHPSGFCAASVKKKANFEQNCKHKSTISLWSCRCSPEWWGETCRTSCDNLLPVILLQNVNIFCFYS